MPSLFIAYVLHLKRKVRRTEATARSHLQKQEHYSEKHAPFSPALGPEPSLKVCEGVKTGCKTESSDAFPKGISFICNRKFKPKFALKKKKTRGGCVVKGKWEEIGRYNVVKD